MAKIRNLFLLLLFLSCTGLTLNAYAGPECGNGEVEEGEECDDANDILTDLCDTFAGNPNGAGECTLTFCGDKIVQNPNGKETIFEDCDEDTLNCNSGCLDANCADMEQNQDESDVDCGGSICDGCIFGEMCNVADDCVSGNCVDGTCAEPIDLCFDLLLNQDETDIDCGGSICDARCVIDDDCSVDSDCGSGNCDGGVCAEPVVDPTCFDGLLNQDETDIDCGGSICDARCVIDDDCSVDSDCSSNNCDGGVCAEPVVDPTCDDGIKNQDETDIDCGGSICDACDNGDSCLEGGDCVSGFCILNICADEPVDPTCDDGIKNQDETDIDCGGSVCDACENDDSCLEGSDCVSGFCNAGNVCADEPAGDCPNEYVTVDGCDSGVPDRVVNGGCITEEIDDCNVIDLKNHGEFVRCSAHLLNGLVSSGDITYEEMDAIQACSGMSSYGKK